MRKLTLLALATTMLIAPIAKAGTVADPEVLDWYGDAHIAGPTGLPVNIGWADIGRVWFSTAVDSANDYIGFDVHIVLLNSADDPAKDVRITMRWMTGILFYVPCQAVLDVWRTDPGEPVLPAPSATLYTDCGSGTFSPVLTTTFTESFGGYGWDLTVPIRLDDMTDSASQDGHDSDFNLLLSILGVDALAAVPADTPSDPVQPTALVKVDSAGECSELSNELLLPNCAQQTEPYVIGS